MRRRPGDSPLRHGQVPGRSRCRQAHESAHSASVQAPPFQSTTRFGNESSRGVKPCGSSRSCLQKESAAVGDGSTIGFRQFEARWMQSNSVRSAERGDVYERRMLSQMAACKPCVSRFTESDLPRVGRCEKDGRYSAVRDGGRPCSSC